jgi:hypothetical protein
LGWAKKDAREDFHKKRTGKPQKVKERREGMEIRGLK